MNIYFGHSRDLDYQIYYNALKNNETLKKYNILLPHELDHNSLNGRSFYKKENFDVLIAEISMPSTGLGMELAWACDEEIPIYCFYKKGTIFSNAIKSATDSFIEYKDIDDFINKVINLLES